MSDYIRIPGVETPFAKHEFYALKEHFKCETVADFTEAGKRYESLFFMYDPEGPNGDMTPGEDLKLALILADEYIFENLSDLKQPMKFKERLTPRPGRPRRPPLPDDLVDKVKEAKKDGLTNEEAVQRLISLGDIKLGHNPKKAKTILRYIQRDEKERLEREREEFESNLRLMEMFQQFAPPSPEPNKADDSKPDESLN